MILRAGIFFLLEGLALLSLSDLDRAIQSFEDSSRLRPTAFWWFIGLASAYAAQDMMDAVLSAKKAALKRNPEWTVARMKGLLGDAPHLQPLLKYIRKAGLPEE